MPITVNGQPCRALVDTGCEKTVVYVGCVLQWEKRETSMTAVNGSVVKCCGWADVCLEAQGRRAAVRAVVVEGKADGRRCVARNDRCGVEALGGVFVRSGEVQLGSEGERGTADCPQAAAVQVWYPEDRRIEAADFVAEFGGGKWQVRWKWADGKGPQWLTNTVSEYRVPKKARKQFDEELRLWIEEGLAAAVRGGKARSGARPDTAHGRNPGGQGQSQARA